MPSKVAINGFGRSGRLALATAVCGLAMTRSQPTVVGPRGEAIDGRRLIRTRSSSRLNVRLSTHSKLCPSMSPSITLLTTATTV